MNELYLNDARRGFLAELSPLSTAALKQRWVEVTGTALPKFLRRDLILLALLHALDERASGGPDPALRRQLDSLAAQIEPGVTRAIEHKAPHKLRVGTRLLREWKGTVEEVMVSSDGFVWRGATYRSLSQIARTITGTRWNGWVFFGVAQKKTKEAQATNPGSAGRRSRRGAPTIWGDANV